MNGFTFPYENELKKEDEDLNNKIKEYKQFYKNNQIQTYNNNYNNKNNSETKNNLSS